MKLKKIPYKITLFLLTSGASIILGFLSFGGMLALSPSLPLAFAAFALSIAYEGEIYLQNIKGALNKLFKHNHMKLQMANAYLLELFNTKHIDTTSDACPAFFKDYHAQCLIVMQFARKKLDSPSLKRKQHAEKTLRDMEKWFARQLFNQDENNTLIDSDYQKNLQVWLKLNHQNEWNSKFNERKLKFHFIKVFSALAAVSMSLGTTYLLSEAFTAIPLLASLSATTLPLLIVPMAIISGAAYGFLTFNAISDMLTNNRVRAAYNRIFKAEGPWTWHRLFMSAMAVSLASLAGLLTICTAGTWWTVIKEVQPLVGWIKKVPDLLMGYVNPLITGLSALIFNLQNTAESLEIIEGFKRPKISPIQFFKDLYANLKENEHWLQWINPFRILLKVTITPLRIILFLGHLIGIGVTSDRVPGVSQILSALFGIICEGFEDMHYFIPHSHGDESCCQEDVTHVASHQHPTDEHSHEGTSCSGTHHHHHDKIHGFLNDRLSPGHGHSHDLDLPTKALKFIFSPVYWLAAAYDTAASHYGAKKPLTFNEAWDKQCGMPKPENEESIVLTDSKKPSVDWRVEQLSYRIKKHIEKQLSGAIFDRQLAQEKVKALNAFEAKIMSPESRANAASMQTCLESELRAPVYNKQRFFGDDTRTTQFLNQLSNRLEFHAS